MMRTNSNYQKRMSVINPSLNLNDDKELSLNDPDRVNQLYVAVLDHLLTPPHVKEQLMETQPLEKKIQMIKMHNHLFESMNSWGDKENMLLASIQKMKVPDIPSLSRLKIILATGNMEMMTSFLDSGGVSILLKAIENRLHKKPLTELDIAVLFELLSCCKAVMKNSVGMEGVAQVQGSIDIIAKCLRFDYKQFALQILEILSVCAFYSEEMAMKVLHGMKVNARFYQESPFACLAAALVDQDIEVKAAVMQFVNALIMAIGETKLRLVFRSELKSQLFDERIESAVQQVDRELAFLIAESNGNNNAAKSFENASNPNDPSSKQRKLTRKSMVTIFGPRAYDERKVDAMIKNVQVMNATLSDTGSIIGNGIEIKSNSFTINVNPLDGTMAGLLHAAKNAEKIESRFLDMVGGKKTKRRWYELDSENFKWCSGHDKEQDYKGTVKVSTITDIRPYTTDVNVAAECQHCFEIETTDRTYALGCETATEKDNWLTALQRCRDNYLMSKGSYKLQFRELSTQDVMKFSEMFKKQTNNYQAIAVEDQKYQMELVGLDLTNIIDVSRYLQLESIAMGNGNNLMKIFYELLLIPAGAEGLWDGILFFLKMIREKGIKEENKIKGIVDEHSPVFLEMLKKKFKESGGAYTQMSKLALSLISSEQEISRLQRQLQEQQLIVQENEKKLKNLEIELEKTITSGNAFKFSATNPILAMKNAAAAANNNTTNNSGNAGGNASASSLASKSSDNNNNAATQQSAGGDGKQAVNSLPTSIPPPIPSNAPPSVAPPVVDASPPAAAPAGIMDPRFEKYEKMKKMLPEGAVRQKMQMDGFADHEIEAFLNGTLPLITPAATSAPPPLPPVAVPVDSRFEKYEKMKKMLPEGAVRQKMSLDGFTEDEIEGFFNGTLPAAAPAPPAAAPAAADPRFEKYEKMKKMLPEGAVRQKMSLDGFTEQEIDGFFNGTLPAAAPAPAAPAAIDPKFEKFEKMRKMLPEGAVRQKMQLEGISPDEIEAFFNGTLGAAAAAPPAAAAQPDPRYEKFEKMKKMLPEGAVRQKMQLEGFTPEEIDNFMAGKVPMIGGGGGPAAPPAAAAPPDPRFEKFEKMRKMLPEGAVRQKMSLEGFTDQEIERFFNPGAAPGPAGGLPAAPKPAMPKAPPKPVEEEPPEGMKAKPKIKPNTKLRGLFWNKIKSQEIKETIWYKLSEYSLTSEEIAKLEEHFSNKAVDPNAAGSSANKDSSKASNQPKLVSVLDGKRTQNVLILLGKLRKSPEDVLTMIISLEPQILTQELTNSLTEIIPTPEEITAIKAFSSPATLDAASQLVFHLNRIPRLPQRLECHELAFSWEINARTANNQINVILKGCQEFDSNMKSPFQQLFSMMLAIGNYLNGDTTRGQAYGVKLDILNKFANLKASIPSQGTLMNYLVNLVELHAPVLLNQFTELSPAILASADISYKQLNTDIMLLETQFNKMKVEFEKIKTTGKENPGLDAQLEEYKGKTIYPFYCRLKTFMDKSTPMLQEMKSLQKKMDDLLTAILSFFGESLKPKGGGAAGGGDATEGESDPVKKFFGTILEFSRLFANAVEENRQRKIAQEKLLAAEQKNQQQQQQGGAGGHEEKEATSPKSPTGAAGGAKSTTSDIFGQFHKAQKASNDQLLEEFKNKLKKQLK